MNIRADIPMPDATARSAETLMLDRTSFEDVAAPSDQELDLDRTPHRGAIWARLFRHGAVFVLGLIAIWVPIGLYITNAPESYTSQVSLILPGTGQNASVNLSNIGQASSSATSLSTARVNPTVTYKRLLSANRVIQDAAQNVGIEQAALGEPRIKLVDETSLIHFEMKGPTGAEAQARAAALLQSFLSELDRLRADEIARRDARARAPIEIYQNDVNKIRAAISALQTRTGLVSVDQYNSLVSDAEATALRAENLRAAMRQSEREVQALHFALQIDALTAATVLRLHADTEYQMLADTMGRHSATLAKAEGRFGPRHPELIAAREAYDGTRARLLSRAEAVTGFQRSTIETEVDMSPDGERGRLLAELVHRTVRRDGVAAEYMAVSETLVKLRERVDALMAPAAQLDDLNRDYQVAEAVFASALARTDTSKSNIFASYPLVQVLEDATLPRTPTSPKPMLAAAAGTAATLFLLIAMALAWWRRALIGRMMAKPEGT